jgi:NAD(P)-dependent dehydrogenase (short-subunit alcohol dehydrogenase family)
MTDNASGFEGRFAVVTGASRGIGRVVTLALAERGATVFAVARTADALESLAAQAPENVVPVACDLRSPDAGDHIAAAVRSRSSRLDVVIANAGLLGWITRLVDLDPEVWDDCFAVNVGSVWRLLRACDGLLMASAAPRVLVMSSAITRREVVDMGIYAITKIALEALARVYAAEKRGTRICANAFDPGPIRTGMRAQVFPDEDPATITPPDALIPDMLRLVSASYEGSGGRFDFRSGRLDPLRPQA